MNNDLEKDNFYNENDKSKEILQESKKQELDDIPVSGGFGYNKYYNHYKGEDYSNQSQSEYYNLSEKERQILRDNGCSFELSPDSGEINAVMNKNKVKMSPEQIDETLYGKI